MRSILAYDKTCEAELIALLNAEPDWSMFTRPDAIDTFKRALLSGRTSVCRSDGTLCGYLRALVDGFGIYVSELYVAPAFRNSGHGKALLEELKRAFPDHAVYVLSDEDLYYEKCGYRRVGSIFQLSPGDGPAP